MPLSEHTQRGCEQELARARRRLQRGEDPVTVLEKLGLAITNKLLHPRYQALKRETGTCAPR
ncbi:MAG TPA: hypothetical protein VEC19_04200 [Usitatibacter sp.]|nr:hypothetical protein [Usitatibacter sp.]